MNPRHSKTPSRDENRERGNRVTRRLLRGTTIGAGTATALIVGVLGVGASHGSTVASSTSATTTTSRGASAGTASTSSKTTTASSGLTASAAPTRTSSEAVVTSGGS